MHLDVYPRPLATPDKNAKDPPKYGAIHISRKMLISSSKIESSTEVRGERSRATWQ